MRNMPTLQYFSTFKLGLLAGRNIFPADTIHEALVNEAFIGQIVVRNPDGILGKTIIVDGQ